MLIDRQRLPLSMVFVANRSLLLRNGSFILRSTKYGICSKQAGKGFKSQSNCVAQRKLPKSSRPSLLFITLKGIFRNRFADGKVNATLKSILMQMPPL